MILRHARESVDGQPLENSFEAIDESSGSTLGSCTIYTHVSEQLFPLRPMRIYLDIQGNPAPDALLGAAVARAKELAVQSHMPCRIFTQVEPDDDQRMISLRILGFKDNDGLVRMRQDLPCALTTSIPIGCVVVRDDLDDPIEEKFFLERYNQLFSEDYDFEWLQEFRSKPGFKRILLVAPTGMAGEIIFWQDERAGVIGWLQTSKKWRRMGVARCLLELACSSLHEDGMEFATAEVQVRIPHVLRAMESAGFHQSALILRYPGIDIG